MSDQEESDMRCLLAVSPVTLGPVHDGMTLRIKHLLVQLSRDWDIALISPAQADTEELSERIGCWTRISVTDNRKGLPDEDSAPSYRRAIREVVETASPEAAVLWPGVEYPAFDDGSLPPVVADRIDCLTLTTWRKAGGGCLSRLRRVRSLWGIARYERRIVNSVSATVLVGEDDATAMRKIAGRNSDVTVIPNGVERLAPATDETRATEPTVIFTGNLSYEPNVESITYFVESVWRRVQAELPASRLIIAGFQPGEEVRELARRPGIVLEDSPPDLSQLLRRAWISVAPMRSGSGIKNKVLEAWAVGVPVVMTPLASNGLRMSSRLQKLVKQDRREMADLIIRLFENPDLCIELGRESRKIARRSHSWSQVASELSALLGYVSGVETRRQV